MLIVAIDPGGTTGIAMRMGQEIETTVAKDLSELVEMIGSVSWDAVIVEDFNTAGHLTTDAKRTIELVGGIKALCTARSLTLRVHMPQKRHAFQAEALAMLEGWGRKRSGERTDETHYVIHEEDALAHLLRYEYDESRKAAETNAGT